MNQQLQTKQPTTVRGMVVAMTSEFAKALPPHIPPEKFVRSVITSIAMNQQVADAARTEGGMQSLLSACTKAANDGLVIDGREAALVTFRAKVSKKGQPDAWEDRVQYIPMVQGLMKKARNSGQISTFVTHIVYKKDLFKYVLGDDEKIIHEPFEGDDRGPPTHVYAIVKLKDGGVQREVMTRANIMVIAGQSKNPKQYDPAEGKNYGEWWRKTVIRRISKYIPSSSDRDDFQEAVNRIDDDFDYDQRPDEERAAAAPQTAPKQRGGAAAALKDVTPAKTEKPATPAQKPADEDFAGGADPDATFGEDDYDHETGEMYDQRPDDVI